MRRAIAALLWTAVTTSLGFAGDPCIQDGACNISCVPSDPDCTNLDICIATGFCCVGDGSCTIDCPMPDPDCSDDALCAFYAYCCPDDGFCDGICHSPDRDCCTLGCNAKVHVECLNPSPQYTNSRAVANIDTAIGGTCTGWMIAAPNFMMTNRHCITTDGTAYGPLVNDVTTMTANFDDECSACEGVVAKPRIPVPITGLILSDPLRDFALLTLGGDPASVFGTLPINCGGASSGNDVYLIHHAVGQKKAYDEGTVYEVQLDQSCGGQYILGQAKYTLVSKGGASGAPVFDAANHDFIAIHHCGTDAGPECVDDGKGIPMSLVLPYVLPVISAFGGVATVTEECACPGGGSCCTSGASPGCDDTFCCSMICTMDPYCCETEWDAQCEGEAASNPLCGCPVCGDGVCDTIESPCDCPSDCLGCCLDSECDDQDPCTTDTCDPVDGCQNVSNSLPCDDGQACTENDVCSGGQCVGTPIQGCTGCVSSEDCDDGNPCTNDSCVGDTCMRESVLFDLNGDGLSTVVGDLDDLVNCFFYTPAGGLDTCCTAGNCMCRVDCNRDGLLTVVGDLQCWVDCFFFGLCDEP